MFDTNDDAKHVRGRVEIRTGVVRRRRWTDEEKGRIVAEAIGADAVIAEVARRYGLTPQHLSNWIRAAKDGRFALPADDLVPATADSGLAQMGTAAFVPVVVAAPEQTSASTTREVGPIEIAIGPVTVRVPNGADARTLEAVMRAARRAAT